MKMKMSSSTLSLLLLLLGTHVVKAAEESSENSFEVVDDVLRLAFKDVQFLTENGNYSLEFLAAGGDIPDNLQDIIDDLTTNSSRSDGRIEELEAAISDFVAKSDLKAATDRIDDLEEADEDFKKDLDSIRQQTYSKDAVNVKFDNVDDDIAKLFTKAEVRTEIDNKLNAAFVGRAKDDAAITLEIADAKAQAVAQVKLDLQANSYTDEEVDGLINSAKAATAAVQDNLDMVESGINNRTAVLQEKVGTLEDEVATLKERLGPDTNIDKLSFLCYQSCDKWSDDLTKPDGTFYSSSQHVWNSQDIYNVKMLFDRNKGTFWHTCTGGDGCAYPSPTLFAPHWVMYDFGEGNQRQIEAYTVQRRNGCSCSAAQAPKEWYFQGSNGNDEWVSLDYQRNQAFGSDSEVRRYPFCNNKKYRYFRLLMLTPSSGAISFAQLQLLERSGECISTSAVSVNTLDEPKIIHAAQPALRETDLPKTCSDLKLQGKPSGYYWIHPDSTQGTFGQPFVTFCDLETDGGGWTLCAMMVGTATGSKNWFDSDTADYRSPVMYQQIGSGNYERAHCGRYNKIDEVMVETRNSGWTDEPARVKFNWEGRKANQLPTGKISPDVQVISGGINMKPLRTDEFAATWENSDYAFSEDFVITYADRNSECTTAGKAGSGEPCSSAGPYFIIGAHKNGAHQHYEENVCNGGSVGNGDVEAGQFFGSASNNPNGYPFNSGALGFRCDSRGHVFFWVRETRDITLHGLVLPPPISVPTATSCADILLGDPTAASGYYYINPKLGEFQGTSQVYCDMETDDGGWTLCAHLGGRASGTKNWFDKDTMVKQTSVYTSGVVLHENLYRERAWCGRPAAIKEILVEVRDSNMENPVYVSFNWENRHASKLPTGKIVDDVTVIAGNVDMTPMRRDSFAAKWETSTNVVNEHFHISYSDKNTDCDAAGKTQSGEICSYRGPYFQIGSHFEGTHQHFEEYWCEKGFSGNGEIQAGKFWGDTSINPLNLPRRSADPTSICMHYGHVFFHYR